MTSLGAPAHQGYHVKMTVATNEPGGKKSKVFWIEPCTTTSSPTTGSSGGGSSSGGGTTSGHTSKHSTKAHSHSGSSTSHAIVAPRRTAKSGAAPRVLGEQLSRGALASPATSSLPFTGADIAVYCVAAAAALATGMLLLLVGRPRGRHRLMSAR